MAGDAHGQVDGAVAFVQQLGRVSHRTVEPQFDTQSQNIVDVALKDALGQAVFRDSGTHQSSGHGQGLEHCHAVAHAAQVGGAGKTTRS